MRVVKTASETDTGTAYGHCTGTVRALYGHCTGTAKVWAKIEFLEFALKPQALTIKQLLPSYAKSVRTEIVKPNKLQPVRD